MRKADPVSHGAECHLGPTVLGMLVFSGRLGAVAAPLASVMEARSKPSLKHIEDRGSQQCMKLVAEQPRPTCQVGLVHLGKHRTGLTTNGLDC